MTTEYRIFQRISQVCYAYPLIVLKDKMRFYPSSFVKGNPKINDKGISNCISAGYSKSGINNRGEATGVFYGCRAVLTPDRENKRQNGRRFKECGEPAFCLTAQDKHGVFLCACNKCEHALPIKNATKKAMPKPSAVRQLTLLSLTVKHAGEE